MKSIVVSFDALPITNDVLKIVCIPVCADATVTVLAAAPSNVPPAVKPVLKVRAFGTFNTESESLDNSIVEPSAEFVFNIVPSTASAAIVTAPLLANVTSPLTATELISVPSPTSI